MVVAREQPRDGRREALPLQRPQRRPRARQQHVGPQVRREVQRDSGRVAERAEDARRCGRGRGQRGEEGGVRGSQGRGGGGESGPSPSPSPPILNHAHRRRSSGGGGGVTCGRDSRREHAHGGGQPQEACQQLPLGREHILQGRERRGPVGRRPVDACEAHKLPPLVHGSRAARNEQRRLEGQRCLGVEALVPRLLLVADGHGEGDAGRPRCTRQRAAAAGEGLGTAAAATPL